MIENSNEENQKAYLILKDYTSPKGKIVLKAGDVISDEPKILDRRNYLTYASHKELKSNVVKDMYNLVVSRNDINYRNFETIPVKHQIKLNNLSRNNFYNQAYLNRVITEDGCIIGVMVITSVGIFALKERLEFTRNVDNMVITSYHKILKYLERKVNFKVDVLHVGFGIREDELPHRNVVHHLPGNHKSISPQIFQMFNRYLTTGQRLIPMIKVKF